MENVKKEINSEKTDKEDKKQEESLVLISEFDQKHPRIAKIKNFFKEIKDKVTRKFNKEETEIEQKPKAEEKTEVEEKPKVEEKQKEDTQYEKFRKSISYKEFEKYDVSTIAEKGLDALQEEKINNARETLIAAKISGGMAKESAEKSVDNAVNRLHREDGNER